MQNNPKRIRLIGPQGGPKYEELLNTVVNEFEEAFQLTPMGHLCTTNSSLARVTEFVNKNRLLISMVTGIDLPTIHFVQQNPGATSELLLNVYSISYIAYLRICQTLKRNAQPQH